MKPVVFHPAAQEEAEEAAARYEALRAGLGQEFRAEFEAALERIVQFPQSYGIELGEFRACPLRRVPLHYLLHRFGRSDLAWRCGASESSAGVPGEETTDLRATASADCNVLSRRLRSCSFNGQAR